MNESVRLAKYLAEHFECTRREAENYVAGRWVSVDGEIVEEPGHRIAPGQCVELAPDARNDDIKPVTILLHKPPGYTASAASQTAAALISAATLDPADRSGQRVLKKHFNGLALVTPLETEASGLVVWTQEHGIALKLKDDSAKIEAEYVVEVSGELSADGLKRLNHGLSWRGRPLAPIKVSWQNETRLRFALKTPPLGLIQNMCEQVGLTVVSLKRIRIGRLPLASLAPGIWRYLLGYERF